MFQPVKRIKEFSFINGLGLLKFENNGFIGYKGDTSIDSGYIFAPYIPLIIEEEFKPKQGIMSRYAKKVVNNNFYGHVTIGTP